jgi:hypothetical protein
MSVSATRGARQFSIVEQPGHFFGAAVKLDLAWF